VLSLGLLLKGELIENTLIPNSSLRLNIVILLLGLLYLIVRLIL
jgi:hypothetical protein